MKVLCFGSLNVDYVYDVPHFVSAGETLASTALNVYSGGKGLNQSIALAKAGLDVYHAGAIGQDGAFLLDQLRKSGVHTDDVKVLDDVKTGHAIIQKNTQGNNCILLYGGANQRITPAQIDATLAHFAAGDALVLQNEINELRYLVERAKALGMTIALNPSPMHESLKALLPWIDYLILNEIEAAQFVKATGDGDGDGDGDQKVDEQDLIKNPEKLIRALNQKIPSAKIVLTLGENGSLYLDQSLDQPLAQKAERVSVVDTTAAGDTYTGYFLSGVLSGGSPASAMALATRAAAITVTRPGAAPSIPGRDEV